MGQKKNPHPFSFGLYLDVPKKYGPQQKQGAGFGLHTQLKAFVCVHWDLFEQINKIYAHYTYIHPFELRREKPKK